MNADGTNQTQLTYNFGAFGPDWSPDGNKIVFVGRGDVWVMNADGTGLANLTPGPDAEYTTSWSPDGTKITFARFLNSNAELYVMNADGTNQTRLTNNRAYDRWPDWKPR